MSKTKYKIFNIALHLLGFPLLLLIAFIDCYEYATAGLYGIGGWSPVIIVLVLWGGVALAELLINRGDKKLHRSRKHTALKSSAFVVIIMAGLMVVLDVALPPILSDATDGTILYERIVEDYDTQHDMILDKVNTFKKKNGLADSVKYSDSEFQNRFRPMFDAINVAYGNYNPQAITMAMGFPDLVGALLSGQIPIPVVATLILKTTNSTDVKFDASLDIIELLAMNIESLGAVILQVVPALLVGGEISIDAILDALIFKQVVVLPKDATDIYGRPIYDDPAVEKVTISFNILNILGAGLGDTDPNGGFIYQVDDDGNYILDEDGNMQLVVDKNGIYCGGLFTSNDKVFGSSLGYQDMAWLDGVPMMFFIPLMSARTHIYMFISFIVILTMGRYALKNRYMEMVVEGDGTPKPKKEKAPKAEKVPKEKKIK